MSFALCTVAEQAMHSPEKQHINLALKIPYK